jgi:hypothetical protein
MIHDRFNVGGIHQIVEQPFIEFVVGQVALRPCRIKESGDFSLDGGIGENSRGVLGIRWCRLKCDLSHRGEFFQNDQAAVDASGTL